MSHLVGINDLPPVGPQPAQALASEARRPPRATFAGRRLWLWLGLGGHGGHGGLGGLVSHKRLATGSSHSGLMLYGLLRENRLPLRRDSELVLQLAQFDHADPLVYTVRRGSSGHQLLVERRLAGTHL